MARWEKIELITPAGAPVLADAPALISASRATDIPAFYAPWLFNRLKAGYCTWINPFSGQQSYISFARCLALVFWSKYPAPLMPYLERLFELGLGYYLLYTVNDYEEEGLEKYLPPLAERIRVFIDFVKTAGRGKAVWRFDPIVLTGTLTPRRILEKIARIAQKLEGYCNRLIISFIEIDRYKKVKANLDKARIDCLGISEEIKWEIAGNLKALGDKHGLEVRTCCEKTDLSLLGIRPSCCIDSELLVQLYPHHEALNRLVRELGKTRDPGQRTLCGCFPSKDIGRYSTCPHGCLYCYANAGHSAALANFKGHDPLAPGI